MENNRVSFIQIFLFFFLFVKECKKICQNGVNKCDQTIARKTMKKIASEEISNKQSKLYVDKIIETLQMYIFLTL